LIVVNYLQLMTSGKRGKRVESRQQEVSEFSRQTKPLATELDVPVMAISRLNRGPDQHTDKRPMVADLRELGYAAGPAAAQTRWSRTSTGARPRNP
jgi:replicative DNA helicase